MSKYVALLGLLGLVGCAGTTRTETVVVERPVARPASRPNLDRNFLVRAASAGRFEVESARLALSRRPDDDTTQFAQIMVREHRRANRRLELLADAEDVSLPARLQPKHERRLEELRVAGSADFNDVYATIQQKEHREAIALHNRCARHCADPDIRNYANDMLPMLRAHYRHAAEIHSTARR
jgi:putative membrane protein